MNTIDLNKIPVELLKDARKAYYSGNYDIAIELITNALAIEPNYEDARRVLGQVEASILNGEIHASKINEQARLEYNAALSFERAGRFLEARQKYHNAQLYFSSTIGNEEKKWPVAFEAILRMDRYLIADKIFEEALILIDTDKWDEAIINFTSALQAYEDNVKAAIVRRNLEEINEAEIKYAEIIRIFSEAGVEQFDVARKLYLAQKTASVQSSKYPKSKKWRALERDLHTKIRDVKKNLVERKNLLIKSLSSVDTIIQAKDQIEELLKIIEVALDLWDEENFHQLAIHYRTRNKIIQSHWNDFQSVMQLLLLQDRTEENIKKIQSILIGLESYSMDVEYKQAIHLLKSQIISLSKEYLELKQIQKAKKLLNILQEEPFHLIDDHNTSGEFLKWLEFQVSKDRGNEVLYRWYQSEKINYETNLLYDETKSYFLSSINRLISHSQIWFIGSIVAALVFSGILAYAILVTVNKNNPLTLILPILSPVIPIYVTKLIYDQSVAVNDRMRDTRKEMDDKLGEILENRKKELEILNRNGDGQP